MWDPRPTIGPQPLTAWAPRGSLGRSLLALWLRLRKLLFFVLFLNFSVVFSDDKPQYQQNSEYIN